LKTLLSLFLLLVCAPSFAQQQPQLMPQLPINPATNLVTYSAVVPTPRVSQAMLLARAKVWASRVGIPAKSPVFVTELSTDVAVVAGTQSLNFNSSNLTDPATLYFVARISLREGRYQYYFDELTLASADGSSFRTAEITFQGYPPKATGNAFPTRLRKAFDETIGQLATSLQTALMTPLTAGPAGTEW
jgi:hypothetical protein